MPFDHTPHFIPFALHLSPARTLLSLPPLHCIFAVLPLTSHRISPTLPLPLSIPPSSTLPRPSLLALPSNRALASLVRFLLPFAHIHYLSSPIFSLASSFVARAHSSRLPHHPSFLVHSIAF